MPKYLLDSPVEASARFLFAHGAGAPMDSEFMQILAQGLCTQGVEVIRFEFPYMAQRRSGGSKRPPNPVAQLKEYFREQLTQVSAEGGGLPLFIGGKSMGGRVASLLAGESFTDGLIAGLVCLGYPFHPQGKPDKLRTEHLLEIPCPTLIVQGSRDLLGNSTEVAAYRLADTIEIEWLEDGDHDFNPRRASGLFQAQHWQSAQEMVAQFMLRSSGS